MVTSSPVQTARPSSLSPADLMRKLPSQPVVDQIRLPASVGAKVSAGEASGEPVQRSVQDIFHAQTNFLKTELHALGVSIRKRLLEQDAEISALQSAIKEMRSHTMSVGSEQREAPARGTSSSGPSDDILQSFASLIAMYAQPVDVPTTSVPRPSLPHPNGARVPVARVDAFSGHGHEAI